MSTPLASAAASHTLALFCIFYLGFLARQLYRGTIDLYDFMTLSMMAIIPATFILVPSFGHALRELFDVAFPFVIMFSALLLVLFVIAHHALVRVHALEHKVRRLVQELALQTPASDSTRDVEHLTSR
jgi:hypothetical protein